MAETELAARHCEPCLGNTPVVTADHIRELCPSVPEWRVTVDGKRLVRIWRVADFLTALDFFRRVAEVAEAEDHHPDLHLTNYRDVTIELWTHAVGGLTQNDFILAAKLDRLEQPKPQRQKV